jgi:hypothetical protein
VLDDLDGIALVEQREERGDVGAKQEIAVAEERRAAVAGQMRDEKARHGEFGRHRRARDLVPEAAGASKLVRPVV